LIITLNPSLDLILVEIIDAIEPNKREPTIDANTMIGIVVKLNSEFSKKTQRILQQHNPLVFARINQIMSFFRPSPVNKGGLDHISLHRKCLNCENWMYGFFVASSRGKWICAMCR